MNRVSSIVANLFRPRMDMDEGFPPRGGDRFFRPRGGGFRGPRFRMRGPPGGRMRGPPPHMDGEFCTPSKRVCYQ